jgi:ATP-dependent RNA helicase SUPV3L1/SUV3
MTGSVNALDSIKQIAAYLEEDLEVVKFKRKNPLEVLKNSIPFEEVTAQTALIAFSRAEVLRIKNRLSKTHKVSVIYGNLSPEVRKEEARRFRDKESTVLVATDAIAMGLNLPIKTLLFTTDSKFDGISNRPLTPNEIIQIAGRAGRYNHHENGYIGATNKKVLKHIQKEFHAPLHTIKPPFSVKATTTQIISLSKHLKTENLYKILDFFSSHMNFTGPFVAANIGYMKELAKMIDSKPELSLEDKYMLVQAPVNTRSPLIKRAYFHYINAIVQGKVVRYKPSVTLSKTARSQKEMLQAEDEVKKISLYLWIAYKLPELFPDSEIAENARKRVNHYCQNSLKSKKLIADNQRKYQNKPREDDKSKANRQRRRHRRR